MKNHLIYYLFIALSIIVNSCSADLRDEYSKFSVKLAEVTTITTPTTDSTPDYTFSSTDSGAITYGGSCSSSTTIAVSGNNTITLNSLNDGTYADCTITVSEKMKTKKSETTLSGSITITSFTVSSSNDTTDNDTSTSDTTEPTIAEVTAVTTPTNDSTPDYTFSSDETGTITYGGSCSSSTTTTITGNNTITLVSLSTGTYSDCTITVTDTAGNISNTLSLSSFFVAELMGGSMQGLELSLSKVVTRFAGTAGTSGSSNGTGTAASFQNPVGITTDGTNLYVADARNHLIRKIVISTGVVTTVAGTGSSGSVDGTGTGASLNLPIGITVDETNLYVVEQDNNLIRQIVISTGVVTKVAGTGSSGSADGTGTSASFNKPVGITTDGTNLYVGDSDNNLIRKIVISTGVVTTLAGTGSSGSVNATGTSASFNTPRGITTDGTNLYVADALNHLIRQIVISTGVVTTLAGTAGTSGSSNGTGTSASFYQPSGITTDGTNLYVGDGENHLIRQIVISTGVVTTVAGTGSSGSVDGTGTGASFSRPYAVTTDGTDLYVSEYDNYLIRKIE
jgi:hypothetical protein